VLEPGRFGGDRVSNAERTLRPAGCTENAIARPVVGAFDQVSLSRRCAGEVPSEEKVRDAIGGDATACCAWASAVTTRKLGHELPEPCEDDHFDQDCADQLFHELLELWFHELVPPQFHAPPVTVLSLVRSRVLSDSFLVFMIVFSGACCAMVIRTKAVDVPVTVSCEVAKLRSGRSRSMRSVGGDVSLVVAITVARRRSGAENDNGPDRSIGPALHGFAADQGRPPSHVGIVCLQVSTAAPPA